MKNLLLFLCCVFFALFAHAKEEVRIRLNAQTNDGIIKVQAYHYTSAWGKREVRLEGNDLPRIGKLNPILGWGRDLNDDGKIDSWFMIDNDKGMVVHELLSKEVWGHDAVETKLFKLYKDSAHAKVSAAFGSVFGVLLMSVSSAYSSERDLWREMVDLEEFNIRLNRSIESGDITREQWKSSASLLSAGYTEALANYERARGEQYWQLAGADVLLWATGGIAIKGLMKLGSMIGRPISKTAVVSSSIQSTKKLLNAITERTKTKLNKLRGAPLNAVAASTFKRKFPGHLRALMQKNMLMRLVIQTAHGFKKASKEWKYISFMGGLQITTETFANEAEVWDENQTILAKNVLTHPQIMQNVGYMTTDAFLMTAATKKIHTPGLRFATCAFIALGNSAVTNIIIKDGETDYQRVAIDTGWEAVIGSGQVALDLKALSHFEEAAKKANNPRLKLLGWAVVLIDQTVGFSGYSYVTRALSKDEQPEADIQLVPVMVEI